MACGACKNVLTQVHDWRALTWHQVMTWPLRHASKAHAPAVPGPKSIDKIGMAVVHPGAHASNAYQSTGFRCPVATKEALVDGAKGPLRRGMTLAHGTLAAGVDVLAKAQVAAARGHAVLLV